MSDCIFCKIVKGESPLYKVYEDANFLGFLSIFPINLGHTLLIPKKHYRWVYDVPNFGEYWEAAKKVSLSLQKAFTAHSINFLTIGEEMPHAHIWIIPRYEKDGKVITVGKAKKIPPDEMSSIAEKIRKEMC